MKSLSTGLALLAVLALAGCTTVGGSRAPAPGIVEQVAPEAQAREEARVAAIEAVAEWSFQGRVAVSRGRDGGSGRIDWTQQARDYQVQLSAPVTRQSWRLSGDASGGGRIDGLEGGPRAGADAHLVLLEATGWSVPVNQLPDWVRGLAAGNSGRPAQLARDAEGRPRSLLQDGWKVEFLEWLPEEQGRPALPRRIEAVNGDARVRLVIDSWNLGGA